MKPLLVSVRRRPVLLVLVVLLLALASVSGVALDGGQSQWILQQPSDTRAIIGSTVLLHCQVGNKVGAITWTKNKFILGASRSLPAYPRYSMIGSSAKGEYHLEIKNVSLSDDAVYQCNLVSKGVDQPEESSRPVRLTVVVPPTVMQLASQSVSGTINEDEEQPVACTSGSARPAASIRWRVSSVVNGSEPTRYLDDSDIEVDVRKHGALFATTSTLKFLPKAADDGHFLVCEVRHEALEAPLTAGSLLNVNYKPKVSLKLVQEQSGQEKQKKSWLICKVEAKPNETMQYEWRMDDVVLNDARSPRLQLQDIAARKEGAEYSCIVTNSIGSGNGSFTINSHHAPKPLQKDTTINVVEEGSTVTLECKMDGHPPPMISWYKVGDNRLLHKGPKFVIENVRTDHQGNYRCDGFVPGFPVQSLHFILSVNGPPSVNIVSSLWNNEQHSAEIVCAVVAQPAAKSIQWLRNQQPIDFEANRDHFEKYDLPKAGNVIYSKLKVYKLGSEELGIFNCTAYNDYGFNSSLAQLYLNDNMPLYVMVPGVVGGCVAILILALALILMNRKHLCRSKMSVQSDIQSDFTIKVEALDGNGLPLPYYCDIYSENPDGMEILRNKDYIALPQDNPDICLPPPYISLCSDTTFSTNSLATTPNESQKNGQLPPMRYMDDTPLLNTTEGTTLVNTGSVVALTRPKVPSTLQSSAFYASDLNSVPCWSLPSYCDQPYQTGFVPMQLEPLVEVPTPDTIDEQREMTSYMPRCPSQSSTHV